MLISNKKGFAINGFCSSTSRHGCLHVSSLTSSMKAKLLWACMIALAGLGATLHLYDLITLYLRYEYYDTVRKGYGQLQFPDITLCSSEGYSHASMAKNSDFTIHWVNRVGQMLTTISTDSRNGLGAKSVIRNLLAQNAIALASFNKVDLVKVGITLNELVVHCQFKDEDCYHVGEFNLFPHHQYINCYTFRYNSNNKTTSNIVHGLEHGLTMILKTNLLSNFLYDPYTKSGNINGLRVVVHEKGTMPPLLDQGIDLQPGQSTNIAIKQKICSRLNSPYGICQVQVQSSKYVY